MNNKMLVTAVALGVAANGAASSAHAQVKNLNGSDTLYEITTVLIDGRDANADGDFTDPGEFAPTPGLSGVLKYLGGGSSLGGQRMNPNLNPQPAYQQVAPQSRFLSAAECTITGTISFGTNRGQGYQIGLDGLAIFKDRTEDLAAGTPDTSACRVIRYAGCMEVLDLNNSALLGFGNGAAGIDDGTGAGNVASLFLSDGPDGDGVLDHYCFTHWADALRIIYNGQHAHVSDSSQTAACAANPPSASAIANKRCNSDVRRTLVENWSNIFDTAGDDGAGGCTDGRCTALKHAFRRDDLSGTTDTFLSLISVPAVTASGGVVGAQRTFCNGLENEDLDPIRRPCSLVSNSANDPETVCAPVRFRDRNAPFGADGSPSGASGNVAPTPPPSQVVADPSTWSDLGLVLAISLPSQQNLAFDNTFCTTAPVGGAFKQAQMPNALALTAQRCPDGNPRSGGQCRAPIGATGTPRAGLFNCKSRRTNRPGGLAWPNFDARAYNLIPRDPASGVILQPNHAGISDPRWAGAGHYRIHQAFAAPTTPALAGVHPTCTFPDATRQIGCLVEADHCSIGFAGLEASDPLAPPGDATQYDAQLTALAGTNRTLLLRAQLDSNTTETLATGDATFPDFEVEATDANVQRLVDLDACTTPEGEFDLRYSLSRILWLNSSQGFGAVGAAGDFSNISNTPAGSTPATTNEQLFAQRYTTRAVMDPILDANGFVRLPAGYPEAARFKQCP
jgi:hypothetical protein